MKKIVSLVALLVSCASFVLAKSQNMEELKSGSLSINLRSEVDIPVPSAPTREEVSQDIVYKFQNLKNELRMLENDTTWLRNDIDRLEQDARRMAQGYSSAFFASDLRNMHYNMSRYYNDISRLSLDLRNLINLAQKDEKLNGLARDMDFSVMNLDNRFNFEVRNSAQNLEITVRRIDPKIIGYDVQWNASDMSRYARDIAFKTKDMRWDISRLLDLTSGKAKTGKVSDK